MNVFGDKISLSKYEYESLLNELATMSEFADSNRGLISCAKKYLQLVSTGVTSSDDPRGLAYKEQLKYSKMAQSLLEKANKRKSK